MRSFFSKLFILMISSALLGGFVVGGVVFYFNSTLPKISKLSDYEPALPSKILSKYGTVLAEIGPEKRDIVPVSEIPKLVVNAFLSAEDSNFYQHSGVDYLGVMRAMIANIKAGGYVQGGSTITQQVAKSLLLTREKTISRKIKDFLLAIKIEKQLNKEEILFLYLNQVYLGGGYYGVKSAAKGYYNKELSEVTAAEAAMIAGLLVAPGRYSPYINPKRAISRQRYVLKRLKENEFITETEYQDALRERVKFYLRKSGEFKAGYFTDWVRQRLIDKVGQKNFLSGGYTIETTLDWSLQKAAEEQVLKGVKEIDKRQGFKGPLKNIDLSALSEFSKQTRQSVFKDKSDFFIVDDDYQKKFSYEVDQFEDLSLEKKEGSFFKGNSDDDLLVELLNLKQVYQGVVIGTSDKAKVVFVDLAGLIGVIPYRYFRWARERVIMETRNYIKLVSRPSEILKAGDVIEVSIRSRKTSLGPQLDKAYVKTKAWQRKKTTFKDEKYLLLELDQTPEAQGALVSMDPVSGEILSLVGGSSFSSSQFNRALQSLRQPGSSFKPIIFAAALENGYNPASIIIDSPEALGGADESLNWKPSNYDGKFKGPVTFRNSLEQSRNIPTIKVAGDIGVRKILDFCKRIGFNAELEKDLSLALGSFGINLLDLVTTYAIFPNAGKRVKPISILKVFDRNGYEIAFEEHPEEEEEELPEAKQLLSNQTQAANEKKEEDETPTLSFLDSLGGNQVYDERLAYIMTNLLNGVVLHGTGRKAKTVSTNLAGKTGTTNNYVDAWFIGFSPHVVTGVWTGFDDNQTLGWPEGGSKAALPIWSGFMQSIIDRFGDKEFPVPSGIIHAKIDKETGKPTANGFLEAFVEGTEPGGEFSKKEEKFNPENQNEILEEDDYYSQ